MIDRRANALVLFLQLVGRNLAQLCGDRLEAKVFLIVADEY